MKRRLLAILACSSCKSDLVLSAGSTADDEILVGTLRCAGCGTEYPIVRGIPRFVRNGSYASSFGRQWNWFRTVQLDAVNRTGESEAVLAASTGWSERDYQGRLVLDAAVGAGRFAQVAAA